MRLPLPSSLMAGKVFLNQSLNLFSAIHGCFLVMAVLSHGFGPEELEVLSHGWEPELLEVDSHGFVPEELEELSHGFVPELLEELSQGWLPELLALLSQGRDILSLVNRYRLPFGKRTYSIITTANGRSLREGSRMMFIRNSVYV